MERTNRIVMGSRSYKQIVTFGDWAWSDKQTYVFSKQKIHSPLSCISITDKRPIEFMQTMHNQQSQKDIWLLGGAALARSFAQFDLIDEIILTIVPQTLKTGIPLGLSFEKFKLVDEKALIDRMIQKMYVKN